jgi:periplasmic copper chaperone A
MIGDWFDPRRFSLIGGALAGAALWTATLVSAGEPVTAENAWVAWAPPIVRVHAGYMTIVNRSATDQQIVGAESPDYQQVELHRSSIKDGTSEMHGVDQVTIPANGRVAFEPAGLHVMLIGPARTPAVNDHVRIVLRLRGGGEVAVSAVIRRRDGGDRAHHGHHGHH